jgi:hypothetical protein
MAASQTCLTLSADTELHYKVSSTTSGYLLLKRNVNGHVFKQCLFSDGWEILKSLLPSIAIDLHDSIEAVYQFALHNIQSRNQVIKLRTNPTDGIHYVQLCFIDRRTGGSHSFWLNQQEMDVIMSHSFDISQHLGYKRSMSSDDTRH